MNVAVATVSRPAAEAGVRMAEEGGNAVDAALAASLTGVVTHPGMCSLGGGGFVTVWPGSGAPVTVDGGLEMPGRGLPRERLGSGGVEVDLAYGGGVRTIVGPGSVATPGLLAAVGLAASRYGRLPFRELLAPAYEHARDGFPMPASSHAFLTHAYDAIYARDPRGRAALAGEDGALLEPGRTVRIEHLAESLEGIAHEGPDLFYRGELGASIADHVAGEGGLLGRADLAAYDARLRDPLRCELDGWSLATNPPPAVGGATLAAMLLLMGDRPRGPWDDREVLVLASVQESVLRFRRRRLDVAPELTAEVRHLLKAARARDGQALLGRSSATIHTSAVDAEGLACAVTWSDGYGSGIVPPGTGIWLNNCLGERELNRRGFHALEPGTRLPSNMAPTVGRHRDGASIAIGSPGADRIPTAILQVLLGYARAGLGLREAIEHPRLHAQPGAKITHVAYEAGLPADGLVRRAAEAGAGWRLRAFGEPSMFFGGVAAAVRRGDGALEAAADPRRAGDTATGGRP